MVTSEDKTRLNVICAKPKEKQNEQKIKKHQFNLV